MPPRTNQTADGADLPLELEARRLRRGRLRAPAAVLLAVLGACALFAWTSWPLDVAAMERDGGFTFQDGDLLFKTRANTHEQQRAEVDIIGERVIWDDDTSSARRGGERMREVGLGIVVVELLDGYSKLQVWQGVVGIESRPEVGKQSEKRLNKLIAKMFKKYPPQ